MLSKFRPGVEIGPLSLWARVEEGKVPAKPQRHSSETYRLEEPSTDCHHSTEGDAEIRPEIES